jgi:uncharacterized protein YbjT (DUF2867 family)
VTFTAQQNLFTNMSGKILITGATGTVGSAVVKALQAKGTNVVAASREAQKVKEKFGSDVAAVAFDFADPSTYEKATQGVEKVFLLGPPVDPAMDQLLTPFVQHLKKKGINRVVYLSAFGVEEVSESMPFHANMEKLLKDNGFAVTFLRPTFFAQNFRNFEYDNIVNRKVTYSPAGQGKAAFVDINDIGEVAAKVLLEKGHEGKVYTLTGPTPYSYGDVAAILSEVRGEPIHYPSPSPEEYAQALKSAGAPDFVAGYMNNVYGLIRDGHADYVSPDVQNLLGRKPNDLRNVLVHDLGR